MKSLEQIKEEYALSRKFKSWENFCFVANDNMFVKAIDEIAILYAEHKMRLVLAGSSRRSVLTGVLQEQFG